MFDQCHAAIKALTMKVCNALLIGDETAERLSQRQLADALLRWTILRGPAAAAAAAAAPTPSPQVPITIDGVDLF